MERSTRVNPRFRHPQLVVLPDFRLLALTTTQFPHSHSQFHLDGLLECREVTDRAPNTCPMRFSRFLATDTATPVRLHDQPLAGLVVGVEVEQFAHDGLLLRPFDWEPVEVLTEAFSRAPLADVRSGLLASAGAIELLNDASDAALAAGSRCFLSRHAVSARLPEPWCHHG